MPNKIFVPPYTFLDGIVMEVDHLRRERSELHGHLTVKCNWREAELAALDGIVSQADFNFSGLESRRRLAAHLKSRVPTVETSKFDWFMRLEILCRAIHKYDRDSGEPGVNIMDIDVSGDEIDDYTIEGFSFPRTYPTILFGDGGTSKSYFGLWIAGTLALMGIVVIYVDWELDGKAHARRFRAMFGDPKPRPPLLYVRCRKPLSYEVERILNEVRKHGAVYAIFDSLSVGADAGIESQESASIYFQSLLEIGIGSLNTAHMAKAGETNEDKPFGSGFWSHLARSVWYARRDDRKSTQTLLHVDLFHRKNNTGPKRPPLSYQFEFLNQRTTAVRRIDYDPTTTAEAGKQPAWQRIENLLREKAEEMTFIQIAGLLNLKPDTVRFAVNHKPDVFKIVQGGGLGGVNRVALL